jgi:spermidine synthase/MFS family permease
VGSGCAALIYEVVWLQMLQLVIGSTAVSMAVLLGTFMGGMCLGSLLLPRLVSPRRHPLRVYAMLELGIGALAVVLLNQMPRIETVYTDAASGGWSASLALRGLVSMACLLVPTMLMGATLPAISRWVKTTPAGVSWLGFFYGGNIAGAVAGCLLGGFYLLRNYDMATATYAAAAVNLAIAAVGMAMSYASPYRPEEEEKKEEETEETTHGQDARDTHGQDAHATKTRATGVYVAIALSGLTALGAEVVWTRLLSLLLGGTVYAFSIILAVFLLGLGIGSAAGSFLSRTSRPRVALGYCQLLLGAAIAWTAYALAGCLPYWPINPEICLSPWYLFELDLARCLWAVLPGAVLWGASFPLALAAAAGGGKDPGRLVGGVYAANTVGAIVGSVAFSLVLIPLLGTQWSQRVLLIVSAISAMVALAPRAAGRGMGILPMRRRGVSPLLLPLSLSLGQKKKQHMGETPMPPMAETAMPRRPSRTRIAVIPLVLTAALAGALTWSIPPMPWAAVGFGRYCATWMSGAYPGVLDAREIELLKYADTWKISLRLSGGDILYDPKSADAGKALTPAVKAEIDAWVAANRPSLLSALGKGQRLPGQVRSSLSLGGGEVTRYCSFLGEGMNDSVAVSESKEGLRYFHGSGKVQASSDPRDMRLQRMLGHLTMLTRKDPGSVRSVLVVACGAGVTAGSFVPYDTVGRIVICDIEPMVPAHVAPRFAKENYGVVDDPRTQVVIDDGRHFIRTAREKFDVITSDPIDPWVKGCAALSTREYYEMCKAHLNPGGVMALWLPLYQSDLETAKSAIATFYEAFPDGMIWSNDSPEGGYDIVLLAQVPPVEKISIDRVQDWLASHPKVLASVKDVGFGVRPAGTGAPAAVPAPPAPEPSVDLLATYAGRARDMADWTKGAQINTDRNMRLQYLAGMAVDENQSTKIFDGILGHYRFPDDLIEGSPARLSALKQLLAETGRHGPAAAPAPVITPSPSPAASAPATRP